MKNAPFVTAVKDMNAGLVDLIGAMSVLRALSTLSQQNISESELIARTLQVLVLNQDLDRCSVYVREGMELVNAGGLDWPDLIGTAAVRSGTGRSRRFSLGEGLVGRAAVCGELLHCRDTADDPRFVPGEPGSVLVGSIISVPIIANGESLGVLNVSHPHAGFFTDGHERTLQIFANFLGQMIVNNRLLQRMDALVQERTKELEAALCEAEILKHRYAELAVVDELTGLHNRRFFFPKAQAEMERALRYGRPLSLMLLDIDYFKLINDTYGHGVGDEVLREFAVLLREASREADILARFGGEEFIMALPETDLEGARQLAERIRTTVKSRRWESHRIAITLSVGIADLASNTEASANANAEVQLERLICEADQALYFSKHNGRDQCRYYPDIAKNSCVIADPGLTSK